MKNIIKILIMILIFTSCNSKFKDIQREPGKYYNHSKNFNNIKKNLESVRKFKN